MNKKVLYSAIKKVYLDLKEVEHFVFWDLVNSELKLKSLDVANNTTIMSTSKIAFPSYSDSSFVIKEPGDILKMIDIIDSEMKLDITLSAGDNCISIYDDTFEGRFVITDVNYIPDHILEKRNMEAEEPISYDIQIPVDMSFIDKFIKAKKANKSSLVSIWTKERKTYFQLGENNNFTNKVKFFMEFDSMFDMDELFFSADLIQSVLERNKSAQGKLFIDPSGLMKFVFNDTIEEQNVESTYFLVAQDNI